MRRRIFKLVASITTTVIAFAGLASATQAASLSQANVRPTQEQAAIADGKRYAAEIKLLDPYVLVNPDGTLALAAPTSVTQRVQFSHLTTLLAGLAGVNAKIRAGELKSTASHQLYDPTVSGFNIQWNWTGQKWNWWGMSYWFSEYWTWKIEGLATIGAGIATLCGVIAAAVGAAPIAILCGVAGAILAIGVGWMMVADNGGGVVFNTTWTPFPYGGVWIWGQ
jgi:hypothetical protein